jgi:hypothetical protein
MNEVEAFDKLIILKLTLEMSRKSVEEQSRLISRNGNIIRYVTDPSRELQLLALQQNTHAYHHIKKPCEEATIYYNLMK